MGVLGLPTLDCPPARPGDMSPYLSLAILVRQLSAGLPKPTPSLSGERASSAWLLLFPFLPLLLFLAPPGVKFLLPLYGPPPYVPSSCVWLGFCLPQNNHRHCEALLLGGLSPPPPLHLPWGEEEESVRVRPDPPGLVLLVHPQAQRQG